jgi:excisionase family DNA binding protein
MKSARRISAINTHNSAALSVDEAAEYLRISRATLYRLFREKKLSPARLGGRTLVRRVDADALLAKCVEVA